MEGVKKKLTDFVGRHLIVDASTSGATHIHAPCSRRRGFRRQPRHDLVLPPIVFRYPFANDELGTFCDNIELELDRKMKELATGNDKPIDLSLAPVKIMREFLRRRQMEESGVTGMSIWAESHAAIHTWDEDNYYAFDAFSCKDFRLKDALRLLLTHFDIEVLNCVNLLRFQRTAPE